MIEKEDNNPSAPETAPQLMLEAVGLTKRYEDGILALDCVEFGVQRGRIFAMLGANGAGKTTTINLFLNFIEPTAGEARIAGIASHKEPLKAKRRVAYVSEHVRLYPSFTAVQNLEYFSRLGGRTGLTRDDFRAALLRVGLPPAAHHRKLKDFSKGMLQKCGIAIAILKDAAAILLDEPTAGLDPQAGHEFVQLLGELRDEGKAILMSTHDIFRAKEVADEIGFMRAGKLVMQRRREELAGENLEQLYIHYVAGRTA
jgi:ABC-2 type transport system ATP-binding protein